MKLSVRKIGDAVDPTVREMASPFTQPLTRSQQIEKDRQVREKAQPAGVSKILARARRKAQEEEQRRRTLAAQLQQPNTSLPNPKAASPHSSASASGSAASAASVPPPTKPAVTVAVGPASYSKKSEAAATAGTSTGSRAAPLVADHSLQPTTTATATSTAATTSASTAAQQRLLNRPVSASRGGASKGGPNAGEKIFVTETATGSGSASAEETVADEPESVAPSTSAAPDRTDRISTDYERVFAAGDKDAKRASSKSPPDAASLLPQKDGDDVSASTCVNMITPVVVNMMTLESSRVESALSMII